MGKANYFENQFDYSFFRIKKRLPPGVGSR